MADLALLVAACYGASYLMSFEDGPFDAIKRFRVALGDVRCQVCWSVWAALALVALRLVLPPAAFTAIALVPALSGATIWLASLRPPMPTAQTAKAPAAITGAPNKTGCKSCGKKAAADEPKVVTTETGRGWSAGLESEA